MDHLSGQTHLGCLILFPLLMSIHADGNGEVSVICPSQPIVISPGEDATLSCHLEPELNVENMTVAWTKLNQVEDGPKNEKQHKPYLHIHQHDGTFPQKDLSYKGRTSLFVDELKNGNVWLKLSRVTLSDTGRYRLFIPKLNSQVKDAVVELVVEESVNTTAESGITEQGQKNVTHLEADISYLANPYKTEVTTLDIVAVCCAGLFLLCSLIYTCCKYYMSEQTPDSPPPDFTLLHMDRTQQLSETEDLTNSVVGHYPDPVSSYCYKNGLFTYPSSLPGPAPHIS